MIEIPKIVSQRLHAMESAGVHPDADLMAAFAERSLGDRERVQVLEHLSRCAGCREIVSLSATQPGNADAVSIVPSPAGWLSWPVLRWGAAVACVIVVGAAVTLRHKPEQRIASSGAEGRPTAEAQIPASKSGLVDAKKIAPLQLPDQEKNGFVTKLTPQPGQATAKNSANAPAAPGPVQMAAATNASPLAEVVPGRAKAAFSGPSDAGAAKAMGTALSRKQAADVSTAGDVAGDALIPANLAPRWTLNSDGTLQRSLDSGRTWQTIPVSSKTIFRALAANDLDIWVGGSAGALFHSSDAGQHSTQVRPVANGETLADDIIGVEFTDLLRGKLTTSSAETWITTDAGLTWQRQ